MNYKIISYILLVLIFVAMVVPTNIFVRIVNLFVDEGNLSQLSVSSLSGEYIILVDGKQVGKVKDKSLKIIPRIQSGKREIKLIRTINEEKSSFFYEFEKEINFIPNYEVKISWDAGPTINSSTGVLQYFKKVSGIDSFGLLLQITPPLSTIILFDGKEYTDSYEFKLKPTGARDLLITPKELGYESAQVSLDLLEGTNLEAVEKSNLQLVIEVFLYKQPFL